VPVAEMVGEIDRELHDLCQPLMRLSCHLELGQLVGDAGALRESVDKAMGECEKVCASVARMRQCLAKMAVRGGGR
jgi:hypothetical protein